MMMIAAAAADNNDDDDDEKRVTNKRQILHKNLWFAQSGHLLRSCYAVFLANFSG